MVKSRSVKRNAKKSAGAATAPFPKSRASYFRFARFNTSALYYLRAWHRLMMDKMQESVEEYGMKINFKKTKVMKVSERPGLEGFTIFLEDNN